jgi:hypothetical protein
MSEAPTAEKADTTLKAVELSSDEDEAINYSSDNTSKSVSIGVLLSSIILMLMLL